MATGPSSTTQVCSMPGPSIPLIATDAALLPFLVALHDTLAAVQSDVKDALAQLHALRTAQSKTDKGVAELEAVVGTQSKSRAKRVRGRGKAKPAIPGEALLVLEDVPEKTLLQSVASIQSAIDALLARDSLFSVQAPSSPLLSIATPVSAPEKEHAHTSIQACPSPTRELGPVLPSVDPASFGWFASNSVQPTTLTAALAHILRGAHLPSAPNTTTVHPPTASDTRIPPRVPSPRASPSDPSSPPIASASGSLGVLVGSPTSMETPPLPTRISIRLPESSLTTQGDDEMTPRKTGPLHTSLASPLSSLGSLSSTRASSMAATDAPGSLSSSLGSLSGAPVSDTTRLPTASSSCSLGASVGPAGAPSPATVSIRRPEVCLATQGVDGKIKSSWTEPLLTSLASPLSSLSSTRAPSVAASGPSGSEVHVGGPGGSHTKLPEMTCDPNADETLVPRAAKTIPESTPARRQSPPVATQANSDASCLPTPPSETVAYDRVPRIPSRSTRDHDLNLMLPTRFSAIPTPLCLTPKSSSMDIGGRQWSLGVFSESMSSLTPPSSSALGRSLVDGGAGDVHAQAGAHDTSEEHTDSPDAGRPVGDGHNDADGVSADVQMHDARSSPRRDPARIDASTLAANTEVPDTTLPNASASDQDVSDVPLMPDDVDPSNTPRPTVTQLPEHDPTANTDANDIDIDINLSYPPLPHHGYDIRFSSPLRRLSPSPSPLASTTRSSQYATPSPSDTHPTPDEDEVWHALMLGASGVSTPMSGSGPMLLSHHSSREPSQPLSIDPSVLHDPNPLSLGLSQVHGSDDSSFEETVVAKDKDKDADAGDARRSKTPLAPVRTSKSRGSKNTFSSNYPTAARHSEPYRAPSVSVSHATGTSTIRATSEATHSARVLAGRGGHGAGGPSASVNQLVLLARREPLRIYLKVPDTMRGVKRKRDGHGEGDGQGVDGDMMPADEAGQGDGDVPPDRTHTASEVPRAETFTPIAPGCSASTSNGLADSTIVNPDTVMSSASRKKTKKEGEQARGRGRFRKIRRGKAKPKSPVRYHVRNGQLVTVGSEPGPPVTPYASQLSLHAEEAGSSSQTCHRKGQENQAMKTPLSSPENPNHSSPHRAPSSPTKQDAWNTISRGAGMWPELPSVFSQWDVQFIQCDSCDKWYHYGCVAIESGDPRLQPRVLFVCPTCHTQSSRRQTLRNHDGTCGRPDCPEPPVTSDNEVFFVEKLVGRKKMEGYVYMWLVKWEGYPMTQSTWIPKENVVGDGTRLFNAFLEDALEEGADLRRDVVLLQEALDAGWDAEGRQ